MCIVQILSFILNIFCTLLVGKHTNSKVFISKVVEIQFFHSEKKHNGQAFHPVLVISGWKEFSWLPLWPSPQGEKTKKASHHLSSQVLVICCSLNHFSPGGNPRNICTELSEAIILSSPPARAES